MTVFCSKQMGDKEMKKYIALYGILAVSISSGNAFGVTTIQKCCNGSLCSTSSFVGCTPCETNFDCGGGPILIPCPDECPFASWTLVDVNGIVTNTTPRYEALCVSGACKYRCASGSYGNPTSSTSGCSRCPSVGSDSAVGSGAVTMAVPGQSVVGATDITDCYAEADTQYSDSTGKFKFTEDCYYTK